TVPQQKAPVKLAIPAWAPGYYQILQFQRDISDVRASDSAGHNVEFKHPDERTWEIPATKGSCKLAYSVKADDAGFGFFRSHLDAKTGYLSGPSALMYLVDGKKLPTEVHYHLP